MTKEKCIGQVKKKNKIRGEMEQNQTVMISGRGV
jgi:hypothetical protein